MKFRKIVNHNDRGEVQKGVSERLEYFHHYWSLLFHTDIADKSIFFNSQKFESHRSLLSKCLIELEANSSDGLNYALSKIRCLYLVKHEYFDCNNLLRRSNHELGKEIIRIKKFFGEKGLKKNDCISKIKSLQNRLFEGEGFNYNQWLVNRLKKILCKNESITDKEMSDLEFLINALIVEFYHVGYPIEFIRKIPDIILSMDPGFPKEIFGNQEIPQSDNVTTEKKLDGIYALLERKPKKGYYVFKVHGIDFRYPKPLQIWGVEIYNPQTQSKVNKKSIDEYFFNQEVKAELFTPDYDDDVKESSCNFLVPTTYLLGDNNAMETSFSVSLKKAVQVLNVINQSRNTYSPFRSNEFHLGYIKARDHMLLSSDFYGVMIHPSYFKRNQVQPFEIDNDRKDVFNDSIDYMNCLDFDKPFHRNLIESITLLRKYRTEPWEFNFNELWIKSLEPLFPNEIEKVKTFVKKCILIRYERHYLNHVKMFFYANLIHNKNSTLKPHYGLSDEESSKLGLEKMQVGEIIIAEDYFINNYYHSAEKFDSRVLINALKMAQLFQNNKSEFLEEINGWVNSTLTQVYAQRNLYAHANTLDDFSTFKLKEDFIYVVFSVVGEIMTKIRLGSEDPKKDIENEFMRIKEAYDK